MKLEININNSPDETHDAQEDSDPDIYKNFAEVLGNILPELYEKAKNYKSAEISLTFVNSDEIKNLNNDYRNINEPTDVLSFPIELEENLINMPVLILGDIIICPEQVKILHKDLNYTEAICLMIAHSFLHLIGWDHDTQEKQNLMWQIQDEIKIKLLNSMKGAEF